MKITNKQNLPESLVRAVSYSDYNRGDADISVTGLLQPPRIGALKRKHYDELEEDAADRIWALIGSAAHEILRRGANGLVVEKRLFAELSGVRISGQIDLVERDHEIHDYKVTSVWAMNNEAKDSWTQQLNIYAWLCAKTNTAEIKKLTIVAIGRDWSLRESQRDPNYPQQQVKLFNLDVWPLDKTEAFIRERIALHAAAKVTLPECTEEERWQKSSAWAVMKQGRKSAVKVHYDQTLAETHLKACDNKHSIQFRPGKSIRCEAYCPCLKFCEQGQKLVAAGKAEEPETEVF